MPWLGHQPWSIPTRLWWKPTRSPCFSSALSPHPTHPPCAAKGTWTHFPVPAMPFPTLLPPFPGRGKQLPSPGRCQAPAPAQPPTLYPSAFPSASGLLCWHFSPETLDFVTTLSSVMSGLYFKSLFMLFKKKHATSKKNITKIPQKATSGALCQLHTEQQQMHS